MARRWKAPNDPTPQARQVWAALFPDEPWPKGWRVRWAGFMRGAAGLTVYSDKRIMLSWGDAKARTAEAKQWGAVDTLLHEFVHMRCGHRLRHGREFDRLEDSLRLQLGMAARAHAPAEPRHRHTYEREDRNTNGWFYKCACGFATFYQQRRRDLVMIGGHDIDGYVRVNRSTWANP